LAAAVAADSKVKRFFFEKKKQKTFANLVRCRSQKKTNQSFFGSFCSQKERSSFLSKLALFR